ncbi:MAG TPA: AAC(3) family N-acetyltransferase [Gemmatimonadales bacterium]|nr:AAC(3) family N-acetyltransferase [Gemmatimonadales bacterium]
MKRREVVEQLGPLGVAEGDVLLVHTSFRAVGPVEGGPSGLIAALQDAVGDSGTLVMPSWTGDDEAIFDPKRTAASADLGVVADTFWRLPGAVRSNHPFAFAALGPQASFIVHDPLPLPPHIPESPVGRVRDLDGKVLLLGVDHEVDTTVHLAELIAGVPYRVPKRITVVENGRPVQLAYAENDHCTKRFSLVGEWLEGRRLQSSGPVGHGRALLARSRDVVAVALERLSRDPLTFLHPRGACEECDEAHASVRRSGPR